MIRQSTASSARADARKDGRTADRRRRFIPFYAPERRTGFDRRRTYPVTGPLRDRPVALVVLLLAVNGLSLLDFALTMQELAAGIATEGNPVLAPLFAQGPMQAWAFKSALILLVSLGIWQGRRMRAILGVAVFALFTFAAVVGYHLIGISAAFAS